MNDGRDPLFGGIKISGLLILATRGSSKGSRNALAAPRRQWLTEDEVERLIWVRNR